MALFRTAVLLLAVATLPLQAQNDNLAPNGSFDSSLAGWFEITTTDHHSWDSDDRNGSSSSGSMWLFGIGSGNTVIMRHCLSSLPPAGSILNLKGSVYFPTFDDGRGESSYELRYYVGSGCNGSSTFGGTVAKSGGPGSRGTWFDLELQGGSTVPSGVSSVAVLARLQRQSGSSFGTKFDEVEVSLAAPPSSVTILGPDVAEPGDVRHFSASGEGCSGDLEFGWSWTTPGASILNHPTHRRVLVRFPSAGSYSISASHPGCGSATGSREVAVETSGAVIGVSGQPYMYQPEGTALGRSSYWVRNWGTDATTITLDQSGDFFTQGPGSFTLEPNQGQQVDLAGLEQPLGLYVGRSFLLGSGVPSSLDGGILTRLFVFDPDDPYGQAEPLENRVDRAEPGQFGIFYRNSDPSSPVIGYVVSDVAWIRTPEDLIEVAPGETKEISLEIDRSLRPDADFPLGSVFGNVLFTTPETAGSGKRGAIDPEVNPNASATLVSVVDTAAPPAEVEGIPSLDEDELAIFVPGVGHVVGSVGTFISDLSVVNRDLHQPVRNLALYFNPIAGSAGPGSQLASVASVPASGSLVLADLVNTVYGQQSQLGSLQIRSGDIEDLAVTATVFNKSDPAGTFGTTIPVFRSDRAVGPGGKIYLTGLTSSATSHTNLFLQETSGEAVQASSRFYGTEGELLASRTDTVPAFSMSQLGQVVPEGAVSAVVENSGSTGALVAYATPVDRRSGDTWAVSDWPRQLGYSHSESVVIPVAGALRGANDTFFRTDAALFAVGETGASGVLRYYDRTGPVHEEQIDISSMSTLVLSNVTESLFGIEGDTVGHMTFTPSSGELVVTSRNFTTIADAEGTFGSGVPTLSLSSSLAPGEIAQFGGISDAALETIQEGAPATFRTNFGMVETGGERATVRVNVRFDVPLTTSRALVEAAQDFELGPNQFLLLGNLVRTILGAQSEELIGDVSNVEVWFEHIDGTGRVAVFTSSVDNGTGDSILRAE